MKKLQLLIEIEYRDDIMHSDDQESKDWFFNKILLGTGGKLSLYSGEIGDAISETCKVIEVKEIE